MMYDTQNYCGSGFCPSSKINMAEATEVKQVGH
jgi:hypothetical protein